MYVNYVAIYFINQAKNCIILNSEKVFYVSYIEKFKHNAYMSHARHFERYTFKMTEKKHLTPNLYFMLFEMFALGRKYVCLLIIIRSFVLIAAFLIIRICSKKSLFHFAGNSHRIS